MVSRSLAKCSVSCWMTRSRSSVSDGTGRCSGDGGKLGVMPGSRSSPHRSNRTVVDRFGGMRDEECLVEQRRRDAAQQWPDPVNRLTLEDAAGDRRPERARRVHRCAGERSNRENVRGDGETDREPTNLRRARIDGSAENDEDEKECRDELEGDRLARGYVDRDRLPAESGARRDLGRKQSTQGVGGEN